MEENKPISIVEEAKAIRDEIFKAKEELKAENDRKEKLQANDLLASSAGAHLETPQISEDELKKQKALELFKGTGIEDALNKYHG